MNTLKNLVEHYRRDFNLAVDHITHTDPLLKESGLERAKEILSRVSKLVNATPDSSIKTDEIAALLSFEIEIAERVQNSMAQARAA